MPGTTEPLRTLTSDYEHFLESAGDDRTVSLEGATIVFDTNALLGLYRRHFATTERILQDLDRIRDRVFLPGEVQREFWLARDHVLREVRDFSSGQQVAASERAVQQALEAEARWGIGAEQKAELKSLVAETFQRLKAATRAGSTANHARAALTDPEQDAVVSGLSRLFAGRTGEPLTPEERRRLEAEADDRFARRRPPGYRDAGKPNGGHGDYFIWRQLVAQAQSDGRPVIFVTDDVKEDWWRQAKGDEPINARFELVEEMRQQAGVEFRTLQFAEFLDALAEDPGSALDESAVDDGGEDDATTKSDEPSTLWTLTEFATLKKRLVELNYEWRALVLTAAQLKANGVLTRDEVLGVLSLSPDAKLTGFTRPVRRVQQALTAEGELREGLPWALTAGYDGPGKARRFAVPPEVADQSPGPGMPS